MGSKAGFKVAVVHARQNDALATALVKALESSGASVTRRKIMGVPSKTFGDDLDPAVRDADRVVVLMSPWLHASDWAFSQESFAVLARDAALLLWVVAPTRYGGCPLAEGPVVATEDEPAAEVAAKILALLEGGSEPSVRVHQDVPNYASPSFAVLAERIEGLHALKATVRGVRGLSAAIKRTAGAMRSGPQLSVGETLGNGLYRLLENVGHGPLASVWRARDRESGEIVAVKVLHAQFVQDPDVLGHFFEMARTLADVEHAHVARIIDPGGTDQGFPYFVRGFFDGGSLEDVVAAGDFTVARAVQTVLDVSRALEHGHAAGLLHRNVKPSNVLFAADGAAVLADFSPARDVNDASDTLYLAPETQDPTATPTASSDVYALAMTTLFALHGSALPFWVLRSPERLVEGLEVGDAVKRTLLQALDWDPQARTSSVDKFVEGLLSDEDLVRTLGEAAAMTGRFGVAAEHLRELLSRGEGRPVALLLNLARTLIAAGDDAEARLLLREVLTDGDALSQADALELLRGITERTGDWAGFAEALHERAMESTPPTLSLLLEVARVRTDQLEDDEAAVVAWQEVLEHHTHRGQAAEALSFLVSRAEDCEDWASFVQYGRDIYGYTLTEGQPELAYQLGTVCMDRLADTQGALLWLQRAVAGGFGASDLAERLERIRSARGEWRQVVALMIERAEALEDEDEAVRLLLKASQVALYAHNHHEEAAAILLRVLLRDPEHREALRFLARHHARAGRDDRALALYGRLAPHEERGRDGESVELRVADNIDYASVLLRNDRPRGAQLCLEAALDLNPAHLPTLRHASQLSFDLGKWEEARMAYLGLLKSYESAANEPALVEAVVKLGDLSWLEGDLIKASTYYNRALELDADEIRAWWGKAKVALSGNMGSLPEAVVLDQPWLVAAPVRMTPHEALARLLCALLHPPAIEAWMKLDPMGPEVLALVKRQHAIVLASAMVDLMLARQLVRAELFRRLGEAFPAWVDPIEAVRRLWFDGPVEHAFSVGSCYRWTAFEPDFDPAHHRDVVSMEPPFEADAPVSVRPSLAALHHGSAWKKLLRRPQPVEPPLTPPSEDPESPEKSRSALVIFSPNTAEQRVVRVDESMRIGSDGADDVVLPMIGLQAAHLEFERIGSRYYLTANGPVEMGDDPLESTRMFGGERFRIGDLEVDFLLFDADDPPQIEGGLPVSRPYVTRKDLEDDDLSFEIEVPGSPGQSVAKAAVFYTKEGSEHILPIVGELIVFHEEEGELRTTRDYSADFDAQIVLDGAQYILIERADSLDPDEDEPPIERVLSHGDEFVIGTHMLRFRLLDRPKKRPSAEDIAALWGTPMGAPVLIYDDGTRHGRPVALTVDLFSIGRGRTCDFQISVDASLSRVHCKLEKRDGKVYVFDAGSSNGTSLNGVPLEGARELHDGDVISLGQSRLEYVGSESTPSFPSMISLHEFGSDDPTEVLPVGEMAKKALPLDEGLDKIRVANRVLGIILTELDNAEGSGRGIAELRNMLEAKPRAYQKLLDGVNVKSNAIPGLDVMYNLAQRPDQEQRPLLNFVLGDLIDRAVEQVCELLPDSVVDEMLSKVAEIRHREILRF